jgi:propionyl-CoA carboxylase alpha chain
VLADGFGSVVHLGERECSIQRRHQKVIEEAPSPFLDADLRARMGGQAVALAKAVGYVSAGTVEFMMDAERNFYFLEMNTRLQVEHPVTERVTGLDLVEQMIRIAAGERLGFGQDEVRLDGWAIEARVYAEDPRRDFLPSIGRLVGYVEPAGDADLRIDSGVREGGEVGIHYDPMIAKVIASGADREAAIGRLRLALDAFHIRGVSHNLGFLAAVVAHPRFGQGLLSTAFIDEEWADGFHGADVGGDTAVLLCATAACVHRRREERAAGISGQLAGRRRTLPAEWSVTLDGAHHGVAVVPDGAGFEVTVDGARHALDLDWRSGAPVARVRLDGVEASLQVAANGIGYRLAHGGAEADVLVLKGRAAELHRLMPVKAAPDASRFLLSPMPGLLVSVAVAAGQEVKPGDELAVVEAMKMENVLRAGRACVVAAVKAAPGDSLAVDQPILEFE